MKKSKGKPLPPFDNKGTETDAPRPPSSNSFPLKDEGGEKQPYWKRPKIVLRLDEGGKPVWSRVPQQTIDALRSALGTEEAASVLQLSIPTAPAGEPGASPLLAPAFNEDAVRAIYDGVGMMEAGLFSFFLKIPYKEATLCFEYSEQEKAMLVGPSVAVINKWGTEWMKKFADEIALAFLLTAITRGKIGAAMEIRARLLREAAEKREKEQKGPSVVSPPVPIDRKEATTS